MKQANIVIFSADRLFREGLQGLLESSSFIVTGMAETMTEEFLLQTDPLDAVMWTVDTNVAGLEAGYAVIRAVRSQRPLLRFIAIAPDDIAPSLVQWASPGVDALLSRNISRVVLVRSIELVLLGQQIFPAPISCGPEAGEMSHLVQTSETRFGDRGNPVLRLVDAGEDRAPQIGKAFPRQAAFSHVLSSRGNESKERSIVDCPNGISLSEREAQILHFLINGCSNKVIARKLAISEATVKVHVKGLLRKMRVENRTQAAVWGVNYYDTIRAETGVR